MLRIGISLWSCVLGVRKIARFTGTGLDRTVDVPVTYPSDVAFGGAALDRLFVVPSRSTSGAARLGSGTGSCSLSTASVSGVGAPLPSLTP